MRSPGHRRGLASRRSIAKALRSAASQPDRLAYIQEACRWVEQTPWSLGSSAIEPMPSEPRLRILVAEVQARCGASFAATDATAARREAVAPECTAPAAALPMSGRLEAANDRFLQALAASDPANSPEEWASRAALAWCAEPDVSGAERDLG